MPVRRRARVIRTDPARFAHAAALLENNEDIPPGPPTVHADVIRPGDLVALSVDAVNCELVAGGAKPAFLRPLPDTEARLVVRLAFQHLGEQATYEGFVKPIPRPPELGYEDGKPVEPDPVAGEGPDARPPIPAGARPARSSRLVFSIPAEETIEFSSAGILAAMGRLTLVVHSLAQPGDAPVISQAAGPVIVLPGGLLGEVVADGIKLSTLSKTRLRRLGLPEPGSLEAAAFEARQLRRARALLHSRSVISAPPGVTLGDDRPIVIPPRWPRPPRPRPILSRPPTPGETAIEAPYRLVISPSEEARWAHATEPVPALDEPRHVELWHSRLGIAAIAPDGSPATEERDATRRIVRAVWARDRDTAPDRWPNPTDNLGHEPPFADPPFRMSLDRADRHMLVRQTSESWLGANGRIAPVPVAAKALWLSGLGAWLDLHGSWNTKPYSAVSMSSVLAWDHLAPLGRDQYVRVVYPGFLYPWGHRAALVKVTERKMKDVSPSVAGLYQRKFLVIGEPLRMYPDPLDLPLTQAGLTPLVTPTLDEPSGVVGDSQDDFFWPSVGGARFMFTVHGVDHDGAPVQLPMPLIWVAEHYHGFGIVDSSYDKDPGRHVDAFGQRVAFAPSRPGDDTSAETARLSFRGKASFGTATPRMSMARVNLPAAQRIAGTGVVPIAYHPAYKSAGFANPGELWARLLVAGEQVPEHPTDEVVTLPKLSFASGTDKGGGFLAPNLPMRGLSRRTGVTGDAAGSVNPKQYLKGALPKLFGLVSLDDLIDLVDSDVTKIPSVVSEVVDRVEAFMADLARAKAAVDQAVDEAQKVIARAAAKPADVQAQAADALAKAQDLQARITSLADELPAKIATIKGLSEGDATAVLQSSFDGLKSAVQEFKQLGASLPPYIKNLIDALADLLLQVLQGGTLITDLLRSLEGFASSFALVRFRYEWKPTMITAWPSSAVRILELQRDSFLLGIYGQAGGAGPAGVQILAELRDFTLHLLPKAPLIRLPFEHLSFKAGSSGKPEVDLVLKDIEFCGVLSFVEDIKDTVPLDGFSDPPYMDVRPEGLVAGFSVALPDIAVGMFAITNLSLGADVQVPFLGKVVTVGFNFCTRERPFTIAVAFLGGGGWAGVRISPDGLDVLEVGLEAGACIAVDFGVASGSVSAMLGVYIRLEGDEGSIAGYFRLRGEVDVLGLVSASIELYMELKYDTKTGKLTGRASITLSISVMGLSKSVQVSAQRTFAGSNGDPSFAEVMGVDAAGGCPAWNTYCLAFAGE